MYTLYLDETKIENAFFVVGGLIVEDFASKELKDSLFLIKNSLESKIIPPDIEIKWNYSQTKHSIEKQTKLEYTQEEHTQLKTKIIDTLVHQDNISGIVYIIPANLYENNGWRSYSLAFNIILGKFQAFLAEKNSTGQVLIDELSGITWRNADNQIQNLSRNDIQNQLDLYIVNAYTNGTGRILLDRICGIYPQINSSISIGHQFNDIFLGITNYYIQNFQNDTPLCREMFNNIKDVFWSSFTNSAGQIANLNKGINLYPQSDLAHTSSNLYKLMQKLKEDFNLI